MCSGATLPPVAVLVIYQWSCLGSGVSITGSRLDSSDHRLIFINLFEDVIKMSSRLYSVGRLSETRRLVAQAFGGKPGRKAVLSTASKGWIEGGDGI
jgi:hypothetical protein